MAEFLNPAGVSFALAAVVFAASLLQSVTGIGFGVIAGPMLLVAMGSSDAIQVSIVLSFMIAVILLPTIFANINKRLLVPLLIGVCIGSPFGALAFAYLSIDTLKIFAAVVVGFMTLISTGIFARYPIFEQDSKPRRVAIGWVCGVLNTTLAMPGPPVAAYATAIKSSKDVVRSTTLGTFLLAYPLAMGFQVGVSGSVSDQLAPMAQSLWMPTVAGAVGGLLVAKRVPENLFKMITTGFLVVSTLALLIA